MYGLTDGGGDAVSRYSYDVYGARSSSTEAVATKWGFTGRVHETGIAGAMYLEAITRKRGQAAHEDMLEFSVRKCVFQLITWWSTPHRPVARAGRRACRWLEGLSGEG